MHSQGEDRSDSSDSELEDYKYRYYKELRDGRVKIKVPSRYFRCPYCRHYDKEYTYLDILRHASRIGRDSKSATFKEKAKHLGLERYLERYMESEIKSSRSRNSKSSKTTSRRSTEPEDRYRDDKTKPSKSAFSFEPVEVASSKYSSEPTKTYPDACKSSRPVASTIEVVEKSIDDEEPIVRPWMVVVANIPVECKDGQYVGESGRKLTEEWASQGYNPLKVHPLWNFQGHSGFAIVVFDKDWDGLKNAMLFVKSIEKDNHGKREWYSARARFKGDKLYAWIAGAEEFNSKGLIGDFLCKNGDLKLISYFEREDKNRDTKLVTNLTTALEGKSKKCEEIEKKSEEIEKKITRVMRQKEEVNQHFNEELKQMQREANDQLQMIFNEHDHSILELFKRNERNKLELKLREKELKEREALNESEKRKLEHEKEMNEMAIMDQKKADKDMLKLAEDQKMQKEKIHQQIIELEKKLDDKQRLELEIEQMRGAVGVMKHMSEDGDSEAKKKIESIEKELKEKEEDLADLDDLSQALIIKERKTNDELQDARKELIHGLRESRAYICVKRMGELDEKPFHNFAEKIQ